MSGIDSEAVFGQRIAELGLSSLKPSFENYGWTTIARFAFSVDYSPHQGQNDKMFVQTVLVPLTSDPNDARVPAIRRLFFECHTAITDEAHRTMTGPAQPDQVREMAGPEREARFDAYRKRFGQNKALHDLEPSNKLVDKLCHQQITGKLVHLKWNTIGRRDLEDEGETKDTYCQVDERGFFRQYSKTPDCIVDVSDTFLWHRAMMRRGCAMHLARLMDYDLHESLIDWYILEMNRPPIDERHERLTLRQIYNADVAIFKRLAELTRAGLGLELATGNYPLDKLLPSVLLEPRIIATVSPLKKNGAFLKIIKRLR